MLLLRKLPKFETMYQCACRYPELDPTALGTSLTLLRVASDLIEALEANLARHGISQGRFTILLLLNHARPAGLSPSELADKCGVRRASITGLVEGLTRDRLVRREPDLRDRRAVVVKLTRKGESFLQKILPSHFKWLARVMQDLSQRERKDLMRLAGKIDPNVRGELR